MRKAIWVVVMTAALVGGIVVVNPKPALATQHGLCLSNYASTCARESGGNVDAWPQDISGDSYQDYTRNYVGQVSSSGCWPFRCGGGMNAQYNGDGVWTFRNIATLNYIDSSGSREYADAPYGCSATFCYFVWTPTGALINVGDTDYWGSPQYLVAQGQGSCHANYYQQLATWNPGTPLSCLDTWTWRNAG